MKIVYTRDEVIEIMKTVVSELIDVEITDIEFSHYGNDFLHIECTKKEKTESPQSWMERAKQQIPSE